MTQFWPAMRGRRQLRPSPLHLQPGQQPLPLQPWLQLELRTPVRKNYCHSQLRPMARGLTWHRPMMLWCATGVPQRLPLPYARQPQSLDPNPELPPRHPLCCRSLGSRGRTPRYTLGWGQRSRGRYKH